ncbi:MULTISPECIES: hypothetical protein [Calditerrivibrio]|jgi:hypothetical protein|uniref:hypothetical protein n=1 Tax=Calditerrivibrio TaxID=545865 RepID=UPI003C7903CE
MKDIKAEEIRIKAKYKELILKGKINLPTEAAKKLTGPDTAYHLYNKIDPKKRG